MFAPQRSAVVERGRGRKRTREVARLRGGWVLRVEPRGCSATDVVRAQRGEVASGRGEVPRLRGGWVENNRGVRECVRDFVRLYAEGPEGDVTEGDVCEGARRGCDRRRPKGM